VVETDFVPAILCKSCTLPIPLPQATHPDPSRGLGSWPKDRARRNFECPACGNIYEYSAKDVELALTVPPSGSRPRSVVSIELPCGVVGCVTRVRIQTLMEVDADLRKAPKDVIARSFAHAIRCEIGHTLTGIAKQGIPCSAHFDEDWKRRE
jgi:hypothetical protein